MNPGTSEAKCVGKVKQEIVKSCGKDKCIEGLLYCKVSDWEDGWSYGSKCAGSNCLRINSSEMTFYRTPSMRFYGFGLNYIITSPEGINLKIQKPSLEGEEIFLVFNQNERIDDLEIGLSQVSKGGSLLDSYALIVVTSDEKPSTTTTMPSVSTTTSTTIPYTPDCVPSYAHELRGIRVGSYAETHNGYRFKIDHFMYSDDKQITGVVVNVLKPTGVQVKIQCPMNSKVSVGELIIGLCQKNIGEDPVIWVYLDYSWIE